MDQSILNIVANSCFQTTKIIETYLAENNCKMPLQKMISDTDMNQQADYLLYSPKDKKFIIVTDIRMDVVDPYGEPEIVDWGAEVPLDNANRRLKVLASKVAPELLSEYLRTITSF